MLQVSREEERKKKGRSMQSLVKKVDKRRMKMMKDEGSVSHLIGTSKQMHSDREK